MLQDSVLLFEGNQQISLRCGPLLKSCRSVKALAKVMLQGTVLLIKCCVGACRVCCEALTTGRSRAYRTRGARSTVCHGEATIPDRSLVKA